MAKHSIKTTTNTPIWSPAYTILVHIEAKFKEELDNLLADGIIEESYSPWCSPPIPVKMKDMSIRIVVDCRKLNSATVYDIFCMPSTEKVIARLGQAQFLSKLDLAKGFHQVPMADDSKDITTYSCKLGKCIYLGMPFGLRNAPSTFQVMMQRCLLHLEAFSSRCNNFLSDLV